MQDNITNKDEDCTSLLETEQILTLDDSQTERAWRRWAAKNHPDRHPGDTEKYTKKFQTVSDCYDKIIRADRGKKTKKHNGFNETVSKFNKYFTNTQKPNIPEKDMFLGCIRLLCSIYSKLTSTEFKDQDYIVLKGHLKLFIIQCIAFIILFLVGYYVGMTDDIIDHLQWMLVHDIVQLGGMDQQQLIRKKKDLDESDNEVFNEIQNAIKDLPKGTPEELSNIIGLMKQTLELQSMQVKIRGEIQSQQFEIQSQRLEIRRENTRYYMNILGGMMFYSLSAILSFCLAQLGVKPVLYVGGRLVKASLLVYKIGDFKIKSPMDNAILNYIADGLDYVFQSTVTPLSRAVAEESFEIGFGIEDSERLLLIAITLCLFGIFSCMYTIISALSIRLSNVVDTTGERLGLWERRRGRMQGGSYRNRRKYSAKRKSKSVKRKSKSVKRKSKSVKRKSKSVKRKSKSVKRKSKSVKRKSK